jgi:hypothetical protein
LSAWSWKSAAKATAKRWRSCLLCLVVTERMNHTMIKFRFDDTDYAFVVKNRAPLRTRGGGRFIEPEG